MALIPTCAVIDREGCLRGGGGNPSPLPIVSDSSPNHRSDTKDVATLTDGCENSDVWYSCKKDRGAHEDGRKAVMEKNADRVPWLMNVNEEMVVLDSYLVGSFAVIMGRWSVVCLYLGLMLDCMSSPLRTGCRGSHISCLVASFPGLAWLLAA